MSDNRMSEKCTHETSIVLQDCNGFSVLQCTWACGLQLIELHLDNHEVKIFTAAQLATVTAEREALQKIATTHKLDARLAGVAYGYQQIALAALKGDKG